MFNENINYTSPTESRPVCAVNRRTHIKSLLPRPTTKTLRATGFLTRSSQPHHRSRPTDILFPPPATTKPNHVPSLDEHKHEHEHGRLAHPALLARNVRSPLALLPRGARAAAQEAPPPLAIHPRGRDPRRRPGGGGRPDAAREGLSLDHHCAAARSGAEEDADAREGRGQGVVCE